MRNNMDIEEHIKFKQHLADEYPTVHARIAQKVMKIRDAIAGSDSCGLLEYTRSIVLPIHINKFSEYDYTSEENAIVRAQEYIQSVLVSSVSTFVSSTPLDVQQACWTQIIKDYIELFQECNRFHHYWAAHVELSGLIEKKFIDSIVEAQFMYQVRGNRYQISELDPIKRLITPHNDILYQLFGIGADDVVKGLEKLQYSLTQGIIDAFFSIRDRYDALLDEPQNCLVCSQDTPAFSQEQINAVDKVFGLALHNVSEITGWSDRFIDALSIGVGEDERFFSSSEFAGWPIIELPIMKAPFIKIDGIAYVFAYYSFFDNVYRNIQRAICRLDTGYVEIWQSRQCTASEEMVKDAFLRLLPGATAYISNYYPIGTSLKQMNENDIILIYFNYLFIIEVKAGSFPQTPPITDFNAHIDAYNKLAQVADTQCSRVVNYISSHSPAAFYSQDREKKFELLPLSEYKEVFTFSITVDNFNEFAAKAEKMSFISLSTKTIVISYDDLIAYSLYFDSSVYFLHFLEQRKASLEVPQIALNDELDHLGLYIARNMYSQGLSGFKGDMVHWDGFRRDLDVWFSMLKVKPTEAKKPVQPIPKLIHDIIDFINVRMTNDNLAFAHLLLDMSIDARIAFVSQIKRALIRCRETQHTLALNDAGDFRYCLFVECPNITVLSPEEQYNYVYAAVIRNESLPLFWIVLSFNQDESLVNVKAKVCRFSDIPADEVDRLRELSNIRAARHVNIYKKKKGYILGSDPCPCGSGKKYMECCKKKP